MGSVSARRVASLNTLLEIAERDPRRYRELMDLMRRLSANARAPKQKRVSAGRVVKQWKAALRG